VDLGDSARLVLACRQLLGVRRKRTVFIRREQCSVDAPQKPAEAPRRSRPPRRFGDVRARQRPREVVAVAAERDVSAAVGEDRVVAAAAVERVGAGEAADAVVAAVAVDRVDAGVAALTYSSPRVRTQ